MEYGKVREATFLRRPNRFIAQVIMDGEEHTVHVKNTGRCKELLLPGAPVILSESENPNRKTKYDLVAVEKPSLGLVNIDSQAPNQVVREWLMDHHPDELKPEYTFGKSRLDFYLRDGGQEILMEVKGCTLEVDGIGYFPDAPTERGAKHLRELARAAALGYACFVVFVIQMEGVTEVRPNLETDPDFGAAWSEAKAAGVRFLFLSTVVAPEGLVYGVCREG